MEEKYCKECGTKLQEGTKFCPNCGAEVSNGLDVSETEPEAKQETIDQSATSTPGVQQQKKTKSKKPIIIGGIIAAVAIVACFALTKAVSTPTIKLADYTTVKVTGYDGIGTATVSIDWDEIEEKYGGRVKFSDGANEDGTALSKSAIAALGDPIDYMQIYYKAAADKTFGLSNNDTITVEYTDQENLSKFLKCDVVLDSLEYKVSGLEEAEKKDIFKNLTVEFAGVNGSGEVNYNYNGDGSEDISFTADNYNNLSNGDEVTITANISDTNEFVKKYNFVPESLEETYTVSDLKTYCKSIAEIPQVAKDEMRAEADDMMTAGKANANQSSWAEYKIDDFSYVGDYMLTAKTSTMFAEKNEYGFVYKFTYTDRYKNVTKDSYFVIYFFNISANDSGEYDVDVHERGTRGSMTSTYVVDYETLDDVKEVVIDASADNYIGEWTLS